MSFFYLFLAGICETCWPFGFKMAQTSDSRDGWIAFSLLTMTLSVVFFYAAQKHLSLATAYPIWTGIGALGAFLVSTLYFHDAATWVSWLGLVLVVGGIALIDGGS